jgi:predicted metal-dependent phosphoesterase TrpH
MCTLPLLDRVCRESYNDPREVYDTLKRRGMDLVTVTDHDSIAALEILGSHDDFFLSEEVTCQTPAGTEIHVGVYDIRERHHEGIQRRRGDAAAMAAYLEEQRLFFTINHPFSSLTGKRLSEDFRLFRSAFPGVETLNGQMFGRSNRLAEAFAGQSGKAPIAGSDAHTIFSLGRTYTEVPGARNKREFLAGLRAGRGVVRGEDGSLWKLTRTVMEIGLSLIRERPWMLPLALLLPAVPAAIAVNRLQEIAFARQWAAMADELPARRGSMLQQTGQLRAGDEDSFVAFRAGGYAADLDAGLLLEELEIGASGGR